MSTGTTIRRLRPFIEEAPAPMFLSGFFMSPPENFHTTENVEIDIQRDGEDIAPVITNLAAGHSNSENSVYSSKQFTPPIFRDVVTINAFQLLTRDPGDNPFADINYRAKALIRSARASAKSQRKIRRSVEVMASQVFKEAKLTLVDSAGNQAYTLDFQPKSTHFTTAAPAWAADGSTGNPLSDLRDLSSSIRKNGRRNPSILVFGEDALMRFLANADVQKHVDRDGLGRGQVIPSRIGADGATFQGTVTIGHYRFQMWTYSAGFLDPATGDWKGYVNTKDVLMLSDGARLDLTFGDVPTIGGPDSRALPFIPSRVADSGAMMSMRVTAWLSADGDTLSVKTQSRPLTIPTEIDSFGRITVA